MITRLRVLVLCMAIGLLSWASGNVTVGAAQVDQVAPTISDVSPADGTFTPDPRPWVRFTLTDAEFGFDATNPTTNVDLNINGCPVNDGELFFPSVTSNSLTVWFSLVPSTAVWADAPVGGCAARASSTDANPSGFGIAPGPHGEFTWSITATDVAGNLTTETVRLTIDPTPTPVPAGNVEFQDGTGHEVSFIRPGKIAQFFVKDHSLLALNTPAGSGTRTWIDVVGSPTTFNLAQPGVPAAATTTLDAPGYDTTTPERTPVRVLSTLKINGTVEFFPPPAPPPPRGSLASQIQ